MDMDTATRVEFKTDEEAHEFAAFLLDLRGSNYAVMYDYSMIREVSYEVNTDLSDSEQNELHSKIRAFFN